MFEEDGPNGKVQIDEYVNRYEYKLHRACNMADDAEVRCLIEQKADVNALADPQDWDNDLCAFSDSSSIAALAAAWGAKLDTVKFLCDNGATLSNHGVQPIPFCMTAAIARADLTDDYTAILTYLVKERGVDIDEMTRFPPDFSACECNQNALHLAISEGTTDLISLLLDLGADPRKADAKGRTPLQLAERSGVKQSVVILQKALVSTPAVAAGAGAGAGEEAAEEGKTKTG